MGLDAYGGLYQAGTQLLFFTAADTYLQIRLNTPFPSRNVGYNSANGLIIQQDGDYEIQYNVLLNTSQPVDVSIAVRNNGTVIPVTRGSQTLATDSTTTLSFDGRLWASTIVTLAAGSELDLAIQVLRALPENLDAIVNGYANATLTVKKLR